jgi:hypothetical protein
MKNVLTNANRIGMYLQQAKNKIATYSTIILCTAIFFSCKTSSETICVFPPPIEITKPPAIQFAQATISGVVTDKDGNALSDVAISFDNEAVSKTGTNGQFTYTASKRTDKNYTITFIKYGFNNISKSYNTNMGASDYMVQMSIPCTCDSTIIDNFCSCLEPIKIIWKKVILENDQEILDGVISCLKNNPTCNIGITYNLGDANKEVAPKRVDIIRKYFVQKGISETRITTQIMTIKEGGLNSISIYKQK